jgi:hypothetical protein
MPGRLHQSGAPPLAGRIIAHPKQPRIGAFPEQIAPQRGNINQIAEAWVLLDTLRSRLSLYTK